MIALAVAAAASTQMATAAPFVSDQAEAKGFVEDAKLDLLLRNYYFNRDRKDGATDQKDWTQGIWGNFSSGYTQGTVGVGVDAFGYLALKLDGGDHHLNHQAHRTQFFQELEAFLDAHIGPAASPAR